MHRFPILLALAVTLPALAQAPATFSYQGVLADAAGDPVADGAYALEVRLFGEATGGTARAVSLTDYDPASDGPVLGRVLSVTEAGGVVALVGVDEAAALRAVVARQANEVAELRDRLARLEALLLRTER